MDIQLKRGMLEICVLAVLCRGDSYGYQLVKDISPYITVSESTLYPILRRLETVGSLTVYSVEHNGRLRKYYRITDGGRARIGGIFGGMERGHGRISFYHGGNGDGARWIDRHF